jgi:hypothetical protein
VVDFHGASVNVRVEGVVRVRKVGKCKGHNGSSLKGKFSLPRLGTIFIITKATGLTLTRLTMLGGYREDFPGAASLACQGLIRSQKPEYRIQEKGNPKAFY